MKIEEMVSVLQKFDSHGISQKEALEKLKDAEPIDFYVATLELYVERSKVKEGDPPRISKLFKELYKNDFRKITEALENDHPIKRLMTEHVYFEKLLNELEDINLEIKEGSGKDRVVKIKPIVKALKHLEEHVQKEEKLIFPLWYDKKGIGKTILLLEEEHEDILGIHKKLLKKSQGRRENWQEDDWEDLTEKIDELIDELRFHAFHEGDLFYPIVTNELDNREFEKIKKKMERIEEQNPDPPLSENLSYLDLPVLRKG